MLKILKSISSLIIEISKQFILMMPKVRKAQKSNEFDI